MPDTSGPTGTAIDGIIDPPPYTLDSFFALYTKRWDEPSVPFGFRFTPPWDITSDDAPQDH